MPSTFVTHASGVATAPAAGTAIATLAAPPAGVYKLTLVTSISNALAADLNNMRVRRAGVDLQAAIPSGANGQPFTYVLEDVDLSGSQNITVEAVAVGSAGVEYYASVNAVRVA